jgi:hypothetical protein
MREKEQRSDINPHVRTHWGKGKLLQCTDHGMRLGTGHLWLLILKNRIVKKHNQIETLQVQRISLSSVQNREHCLCNHIWGSLLVFVILWETFKLPKSNLLSNYKHKKLMRRGKPLTLETRTRDRALHFYPEDFSACIGLCTQGPEFLRRFKI